MFVLYLAPNKYENLLLYNVPSKLADPPNKLPSKKDLFFNGFLYVTSKTEDILSPYFALNPPAENNMLPTIFELIKLRPSCFPELIKKGLYISIPLT